MFVCIRLYNENITKVVPGHWVEGLEKIKKKNIEKRKTFYSFFSPDLDLKCEPKFEKKLCRKLFEQKSKI
jgi:hypothetical protein